MCDCSGPVEMADEFTRGMRPADRAVIDLAEYRPHSEGKARCLDCGHAWEAVAPVGVTWMECPMCGLMRGRFVWSHLREGALHWRCDCGCDLFYVTPDGSYCPNCGAWTD